MFTKHNYQCMLRGFFPCEMPLEKKIVADIVDDANCWNASRYHSFCHENATLFDATAVKREKNEHVISKLFHIVKNDASFQLPVGLFLPRHIVVASAFH